VVLSKYNIETVPPGESGSSAERDEVIIKDIITKKSKLTVLFNFIISPFNLFRLV
jgi:hypothetical protein